MATKKRSRKAKEKLADNLLGISSALIVPIFSVIFVAPLTFYVSADAANLQNFTTTLAAKLHNFNLIWFTILYFLPLLVAANFRDRALDLYDEIFPDRKSLSERTDHGQD